MTWDDVVKFIVLMFGSVGAMLFLGAGIAWIERRRLK